MQCDPGLFTIAAAKIVGPTGHVYAADLQSLAKKYVEKRARKEHLSNVTFFLTDGKLRPARRGR